MKTLMILGFIAIVAIIVFVKNKQAKQKLNGTGSGSSRGSSHKNDKK